MNKIIKSKKTIKTPDKNKKTIKTSDKLNKKIIKTSDKLKKIIKTSNKLNKKTIKTFDKKNSKKYIFQIGFNRCATKALFQAFEKVGIKTLHHHFKPSKICPQQYLATLMYNNLFHTRQRQILQYELEDYQFFGDMEYVFYDNLLTFYTFFKEIEEQNIGSTFIMNIRNCEAWILSRIKMGRVPGMDNYYYYNITEEKLKSWVEHYFEHSLNVRDYFVYNKDVKKRSKFYVIPTDYKTITQLLQEMGLYHDNKEIIGKINFEGIKDVVLTNEEKKIPNSIIKLIKSKIKIHGDPSTLDWWK